MTPVSVCIATRGDVDMNPILGSLPSEWERVVWNNGKGTVDVFRPVEMVGSEEIWTIPEGKFGMPVPDLGPHARFAAIEHASHDLILVQDDDVIISDPQAIIDTFIATRDICAMCGESMTRQATPSGHVVWACAQKHCVLDEVVCNLPMEFREHYPDSSLVGFGACFHRDAPERAFSRFFGYHKEMTREDPLFLRESCRVFTVLTPRVLVDIEKQDLPYASDPNRLWKDKNHIKYRDEALALAREVRDAS